MNTLRASWLRYVTRCRAPAGLALHPATLFALCALVLNDHWAKARFANALTGKISDFAGLALLPLVLVSTVELAFGRALSRRALAVTALSSLVGAAFALCKCWPPAAELYRSHWALLRAPWDYLNSWVFAAPAPPTRVAFARDPSDLVALVALLVPVAVTRAVERGTQTPRSAQEPRTREAAGRG